MTVLDKDVFLSPENGALLEQMFFFRMCLGLLEIQWGFFYSPESQ